METATIHGEPIIVVRKASWGEGPYDTHLAWGYIGTKWGELIAAHRGLANKYYFIWDSSRPYTPASGSPQIADIEWLRKVLAPEDFTLANDPPAHVPKSFDNAERTAQRPLIEGLACLPNQLDLF